MFEHRRTKKIQGGNVHLSPDKGASVARYYKANGECTCRKKTRDECDAIHKFSLKPLINSTLPDHSHPRHTHNHHPCTQCDLSKHLGAQHTVDVVLSTFFPPVTFLFFPEHTKPVVWSTLHCTPFQTPTWNTNPCLFSFFSWFSTSHQHCLHSFFFFAVLFSPPHLLLHPFTTLVRLSGFKNAVFHIPQHSLFPSEKKEWCLPRRDDGWLLGWQCLPNRHR